jgi:DNA-binding NarL/FixJ family response regulator
MVAAGFHPFDVVALARFHLNRCANGCIVRVVRMAGVLVVHHHRLYADTVARRLNGEPEIRIAGIASTGVAANAAVESLGPGVAVLDMELPDRSSFELTECWSRRHPPVAVAAILGSDSRAGVIRAIRAGARALTTKGGPITDLVSAVAALARAECWIPGRLLSGIVSELQMSVPPPNPYDARLSCLTRREHEILERMASGHDRAAIAHDLGISVNTVRTHAQNLLVKLGVHSTVEAVSVAHRASRVPVAS